MIKTIKLSLVAAIAVAGFSTTVSAKSFEDAIKNVDISGAISVGYNHKDTTETNVASTATNEVEYDIYIKTTSKINDIVSFTASIENDYATADTNATNDNEKNLYVKEIFFTYAKDGITAKTGKQGVSTPWTSSVRGDGILATYGIGSVTLAGGHFANTTLLNDHDINTIAALGKAGSINYEAWMLSSTAADGFSVAGTVEVGTTNINARHTTSKLESTTAQDEFTLTKVVADVKVGDITVTAGYGMTNDANNGVLRGEDANNDGSADTNTGVALNKDNGESSDLYMDQASLDNLNDATAILIGASTKINAYTVGAKYFIADANMRDSGNYTLDVTELNIDVAYTMSKNFSVSGLYSSYEESTTGSTMTDDRMEISLNYTF